MKNVAILDELVKEGNGIVSLSKARANGIPKSSFYAYAKRNGLTKFGSGVYMDQAAWPDLLFTLHLRFPNLVFSHETALYLHGLSDSEPTAYECTFRQGYNPTKLKKEGIRVHVVNPAIHGLGIIKVQTIFGNFVPVYDLERTVCDVIRSRNRIEADVLASTLKRYVARRDKNLNRLSRYAFLLGIEGIVRSYMEVLL